METLPEAHGLVYLGQEKYDRHRCILSLIKHVCVLASKSWGRGQEAQPATRGRDTTLKPVSFSSASPALSDLVQCASEITPPGRWPLCGTVDLVRSEFIIRDALLDIGPSAYNIAMAQQ